MKDAGYLALLLLLFGLSGERERDLRLRLQESDIPLVMGWARKGQMQGVRRVD